MDHHRDGDWSAKIGARITFFWIDEFRIYSVRTLKRECGWLLKNKNTERDQYKKSLDVYSLISDFLNVVVVWVIFLTCGTSIIYNGVAVVWFYIYLIPSHSDPCGVD